MSRDIPPQQLSARRTALDQARAYQALLDAGASDAAAISAGVSEIQRRLSLLQLPDFVRYGLATGAITDQHAELLLPLTLPFSFQRCYELAISEQMTVAELAAEVDNQLEVERLDREIIKDLTAADEAMARLAENGAKLARVPREHLSKILPEGTPMQQIELAIALSQTDSIEERRDLMLSFFLGPYLDDPSEEA